MKKSPWLIAAIAFCLFLTAVARAQSPAAPGALLANVASASIDPAPFLISEKYDGVRGLWDGKTLRTRADNVIAAPAWFSANCPTGTGRRAVDCAWAV